MVRAKSVGVCSSTETCSRYVHELASGCQQAVLTPAQAAGRVLPPGSAACTWAQVCPHALVPTAVAALPGTPGQPLCSAPPRLPATGPAGSRTTARSPRHRCLLWCLCRRSYRRPAHGLSPAPVRFLNRGTWQVVKAWFFGTEGEYFSRPRLPRHGTVSRGTFSADDRNAWWN